jgi:Na+/melibiose symporter-like transporter
MCFLKDKYSWLAAPVLWLSAVLILVSLWALSTPEWIKLHFDQDGHSPVELVTVGLFFFQIAFLWLVPPMQAGRKCTLMLANFSAQTFMAICRELDWHKLLVSVSNLPGSTHGTPFKLKFLTNPNNPLADRLIVAACFVLVFGLCLGTLLYYLPRLFRGLLKLHPVCWSIAFFGGALILIQITDRLPAVLRKDFGFRISDSLHALTTALEEGQELLLPLFIILATLQAHFIYNNDPSDSASLTKYRDL